MERESEQTKRTEKRHGRDIYNYLPSTFSPYVGRKNRKHDLLLDPSSISRNPCFQAGKKPIAKSILFRDAHSDAVRDYSIINGYSDTIGWVRSGN